MNVKDFILWERESRDTIDFKKIYVDVAGGDVPAGLMLSEIVYWHLPDRDGRSRLRVQHEGFLWIAVRRYEWWDRTRLTPRQADRATDLLLKRSLIVKEVFKFEGENTIHVRLNWDHFVGQVDHTMQNPLPNPYSPTDLPSLHESVNSENSSLTSRIRELEITNPLIPYTETTTESKDSVPEKNGTGAAKIKKLNPWYDVVFEVWGYVESLNGEMQKMLQGVSKRSGFKQGNIVPALTVEDVRRWAGWYRAAELGGNTKLNMLEDRMKIQSSVVKWRSLGCPDAEFQDYVSDDDDTDAESPSAFIARMRRDHGWE